MRISMPSAFSTSENGTFVFSLCEIPAACAIEDLGGKVHQGIYVLHSKEEPRGAGAGARYQCIDRACTIYASTTYTCKICMQDMHARCACEICMQDVHATYA